MFQKESPRERRYLGAVFHAPYVPLRSMRSASEVTLEHPLPERTLVDIGISFAGADFS